MDDVDRSMCGVADDRDRDLDLSGLLMLTGKMFSSPRPASIVEGRSSSEALEPDAMAGDA